MNYLSNIHNNYKNILVTGGAGFIGGALVRKLLLKTKVKIYILDKISYSSDLSFLNNFAIKEVNNRIKLLKVDLCDSKKVQEAIKESNPDIVFHLAAESHVDRSIDKPENFIKSNILGTFYLLESLIIHFRSLDIERKKFFRLIHVSTDEVFGSLSKEKFFNEKYPYNPNSPYSASKASSDHLARAWGKTYGLPIVITNCSNNYGPYQFPEKLIPLTITNALNNKKISIFGTGDNIRDWLYVEDHIEALLLVGIKGKVSKSYCIGGRQEKTNQEIVEIICEYLDQLIPTKSSYKKLIHHVEDRPGHDYRYAIDPTLIERELGWKPKNSFKDNLEETIRWYVNNQKWCNLILEKSGYDGVRLGKN